MNNRQQDLSDLREYIKNIDKETTLLLQNLQWDHKRLIKSPDMVTCKYDSNHRIPLCSRDAHEKQCFLKKQGYTKEDILLPDPINPNASTVVKLGKQEIVEIVNAASSLNPSFKKARSPSGVEPLSAERLQLAYTADERRAIHDAVVNAAPFCHNLTDLALASSNDEAQPSKVKSRAEILAELRDMRRRRAKYRVAAKTSNYSHALRDVIKTQMELYAEAKGVFIKTEYGPKTYVSMTNIIKERNQNKYVPPPIIIKQERITPEPDDYSDSPRRYQERSRSIERHYDSRTRKYDDRATARKRRRDHYEEDSHSTFDGKRHSASKEKRRHDNDLPNMDKHCKVRGEYPPAERSRCGSRERKHHETEELNDNQIGNEDYRKHSSYDRNKGNDYLKDTNKYVGHRYKEDYRKHSTHNRNTPNDFVKDTNRYYSDYRKCDKDQKARSHKDGSSKDSSKHDYSSRKHETHQKTSKDSDRHREKKRYCDVKVKQEKEDDYND